MQRLRRASSVLVVLVGISLVDEAAAQPAPCGVERWPVKVLADRDSGAVDPTPQETTVAALGAISIPEVPYPNDHRIAPHELRVYRVRATIGYISTPPYKNA